MKRLHDAQPDARLAAIHAAIEPVLAAHAVELCDLAWTGSPGVGLTLRLTIERPGPEGEIWQPEKGFGVTLDDCADVSRAVSAVLDADESIDHHYTLEVSSPGLDRPIRGARDFARFRGALVKVKLARPAPDGQRVLRGPLLEATAGRVAVEVDGKRVEVDEADVAEANLVFDLGKQPPPRARPAKAGSAKAGSAKTGSTKTGPARAVSRGDGGHAPPKRSPGGSPPGGDAPGRSAGRGGAAR